MKKVRNVLLICLLVILTNITVYAEGFDYYLTNNDNYEKVDNSKSINVKRNDVITVTAILDNKDGITGCELKSGKFTIRWDEGFLELIQDGDKYVATGNSSFTDINLNDVDKTNNKLTIHEFNSNTLVPSGKNKMFSLNFRVRENARAGETKIYEMDGEDTINCYHTTEDRSFICAESLLSEIKLNIQKSDVNTLASLKIDGNEIADFNKERSVYDIEVDSNKKSVIIEAIKDDNRSTSNFIREEKELSYGTNSYEIMVTSESGKNRTYYLKITRPDTRSDINTLKTLTIAPAEIEFNPNQMEYTINVQNEIDKIKVDSTLTDSKSKYVPDFGNREIDLIEGSNKVLIKVVSEKDEERVYTLNINRSLSSNTSLKSLKVNDESIALKKDEFIYNIILENEIDEVSVNAVTNDTKAVVSAKDRYLLDVGENEIIITVTAPSGDKAAYTLNITRKKQLSSISKLKNIKIKGYDLAFDPDTTLYNLQINDEDNELEIYTVLEDETANVVIEGNKNLTNGSIIKINVKAENGTYTRYFINIEKSEKNALLPIIIIIFILLALVTAFITIIIIRKKKQNDKKTYSELDKEVKDNKIEVESTISNKEEDIEEPKETVENKESNEKELPKEEKSNEEEQSISEDENNIAN